MTILALAGVAAATSASCVESREAPALSDQATVSYGPKLYLLDTTRNQDRNALSVCARFGVTTTSTMVTSTDGLDGVIDPTVPHNCFVNVVPKSLTVDTVEVTNELFQLCIDSGACSSPDPSKSDRAQFCQTEDNFDICPVVEVPQTEAGDFCAWIGRRLPTMMEAIAIRQGANAQDHTQLTVFPSGDAAPVACDDAVTAGGSCMATKPRHVLDDNGLSVGGASRDVVEYDRKVFDLTGNAAEWTSDRMPARRGNATDLPWFCIAALPEVVPTSTTTTPAPECPAGLEGLRCVYGQYDPPGLENPMGIYPVCLTTESGGSSGDIGVIAGGSYRDNAKNKDEDFEFFNTFSRREQANPDDVSEGLLSRQFGIRCVDNRDSAMGDGDVPAFTNRMEITTLNP